MKLSKQERIGALIVLAVVILALGAFMLIKPKFEEAGRTKETLAQREKELASAEERQKLKVPLRKDIEKEYQEGEHLADMFFPELSSYDADNAFREFIKQLDFPAVVEEVTVEEPSTETLSVSFYTPTEVEYALKTYVTQGLEPSEEELKVEQRNLALQQALSQSQTIGASRVSFTITTLTYDDMWKFIDAVNNYMVQEGDSSEKIRKAISIGSAGYDYSVINQLYDLAVKESTAEMERIGRDLLRELGLADPEDPGTAEQQPSTPGEEEQTKFEVPVTVSFSETLTFLSIERMQNPKDQLDAQDGKIPAEPAAE